jgi:GNAT superfamily N-acetyltransferase
MTDFEVRVLEPSELDAAGKIAGLSFAECDNPIYGHIFTHKPTRAANLGWLLTRRLFIIGDSGGFTLGAFERASGRMVGTVSVGSGEESQAPSTWSQIKNGVLLWPLYFGFPSLSRAISIGKEMTELDRKHNGPCDLELMIMAVDPSFQRRGVGQAILEKVKELTTGKSIGLSTQRKENVEFYSNSGWHG